MIIKPPEEKIHRLFTDWRQDWNKFAYDALNIRLDPQQQEILHSVQVNPRTSVASGTARGKDYTAAAAGVCFLYLTPRWDKMGKMVENTKVAMTAPTDRQVGNIMFPEVSRIWKNAAFRLPGRLTGYDIRTHLEEWFLTGFKADEHATENWSGFHAANTFFIVTEASGMAELVFNAIEGNLQGNSRILIVFNHNVATGYASQSQRSTQWHAIRLDSLTAPNVLQKKTIFPGQVDWKWVNDHVYSWCEEIDERDYREEEGDFFWEGKCYRPNDLFRVKVRGMAPKVSEDVLIPREWIEIANRRWKAMQTGNITDPLGNTGTPKFMAMLKHPLRLGTDIAGQGRDANCFVHRHGNYVDKIVKFMGKSATVHMEMAGKIKTILEDNTDAYKGLFAQAMIDTLGEGAGTFSRLYEMALETDGAGNKKYPKLDQKYLHSVKFSFAANEIGSDVRLKDETGEREFFNMRSYLYWAVRDWLNPQNNHEPALPVNPELEEELTETKWKTKSNGQIYIEEKDEIKERIRRSPDNADALANTFWPAPDELPIPQKAMDYAKIFF